MEQYVFHVSKISPTQAEEDEFDNLKSRTQEKMQESIT